MAHVGWPGPESVSMGARERTSRLMFGVGGAVGVESVERTRFVVVSARGDVVVGWAKGARGGMNQDEKNMCRAEMMIDEYEMQRNKTEREKTMKKNRY